MRCFRSGRGFDGAGAAGVAQQFGGAIEVPQIGRRTAHLVQQAIRRFRPASSDAVYGDSNCRWVQDPGGQAPPLERSPKGGFKLREGVIPCSRRSAAPCRYAWPSARAISVAPSAYAKEAVIMILQNSTHPERSARYPVAVVGDRRARQVRGSDTNSTGRGEAPSKKQFATLNCSALSVPTSSSSAASPAGCRVRRARWPKRKSRMRGMFMAVWSITGRWKTAVLAGCRAARRRQPGCSGRAEQAS